MLKSKIVRTKKSKNILKRFFSWVVLVFKNIVFGIFNFIRWLIKDIYNKKLRILLAIGLAIGAYCLWGLSSGLLWFLFLVFLFCAWDNRVIAFIALMFLCSCPVLLEMKQDKTAEEMAVYAYFFLVMVVVLQIFEYWREGRTEKKERKEKEKKKMKIATQSGKGKGKKKTVLINIKKQND